MEDHNTTKNQNLKIHYIKISKLKPALYNPRRWSEAATKELTESIKRYGLVDPLVVNASEQRHNIVIGGHFRLKVAKQLGYKEVPVAYVTISDAEREKELNLRLNHALGEWDWGLLAKFDEKMLAGVGFSTEELDTIFEVDTDNPEVFDLKKELEKLDIAKVEVKKGDIYKLGEHRLMCGDSTVETEVVKLMDGKQADMCFTDPPYILDYLQGKRHGKPTEGFGAKKNRRYLETDELPDNFSELWMDAVAKIAKPDFSIIVFENWKNLVTIWQSIERHWQMKNMIIWHLPNRHQGFAAKHKFFNKYDIALLGSSGHVELNEAKEAGLLQEEYQAALFATRGKPHWEGYRKGSKYIPSDFVEFNAADEQTSGQGIIFGVKPVEILIPYLKVLTKRGGLVLDPFGGSGSTMIAAEKLKRRCCLMEKSPVYCEVIMNRWEKLTGQKRVKLGD